MMPFAYLYSALISRLLILSLAALTLVSCDHSRPNARTIPQTPTTPLPQTTTPASTPTTVERPLLSARINSISIYAVPNHAQDSAVSLMVSVGNSGSPSTVQDWNLEVTSQVQTLIANGPVHINGVVEAPGKPGTKIDLDKDDLAIKTTRAAIATNSHVNGVLTFLLKNTRESTLANNGTSVVLRFDDSKGNSYQTSKTVIGAKKKAE